MHLRPGMEPMEIRPMTAHGRANYGIRLAGKIFCACLVLAAAGCGARRGSVSMDAGDGAPDSVLLAVAGYLLEEDERTWLSFLPTEEELSAEAARAASDVSLRKGVSPSPAPSAAAIRTRALESLMESRSFLARCLISRDKDIVCRSLMWGWPWKSVESPGGREYQPDLEISAVGRSAYFAVARWRYASGWKLLDVIPAGFVETRGGLASVKVCFTPFRRDPRGLPESPKRDASGRMAVPVRPEFEIEFRYDVRGPVPDHGRLLDMHRAWVNEMNHILRPFADKVATTATPLTFRGKDVVFAHFAREMPVAPENIEKARAEAAPERVIREMERRNNMALMWITLRRYGD
jgi:hypothetical protein